MTDATVVPQKSTIVRASTINARASAWHDLVGRAAFRLFRLTPRRRRLRPAERQARGTARIADLQIGHRTIRAYRWGHSGPTALLVHGWGGRALQFHAMVDALVRSGWRVVAFDHAGHGSSSGRFTDLGEMGRIALEVARWAGAIQAVIAHSLGAPAVALAARNGGLCAERFAYVAAAADPASYWETFARFLRLSPATSAVVDRIALSEVGVAFDDIAMRQTLRENDAPVAFFHDPDDRRTPVAPVRELVGALERATLHETPGLGHTRILTDADTVSRLAAFVTGQSPDDPMGPGYCLRPGCKRTTDQPYALCSSCALDRELQSPTARRYPSPSAISTSA